MAVDETSLFVTIFSDEAIFHVNSRVNKRNVRIWSKTNPRGDRAEALAQWESCVGGTVNSFRVYGPFFLEGIMKGENYRQMLEIFFPVGTLRRELCSAFWLLRVRASQ